MIKLSLYSMQGPLPDFLFGHFVILRFTRVAENYVFASDICVHVRTSVRISFACDTFITPVSYLGFH